MEGGLDTKTSAPPHTHLAEVVVRISQEALGPSQVRVMTPAGLGAWPLLAHSPSDIALRDWLQEVTDSARFLWDLKPGSRMSRTRLESSKPESPRSRQLVHLPAPPSSAPWGSQKQGWGCFLPPPGTLPPASGHWLPHRQPPPFCPKGSCLGCYPGLVQIQPLLCAGEVGASLSQDESMEGL